MIHLTDESHLVFSILYIEILLSLSETLEEDLKHQLHVVTRSLWHSNEKVKEQSFLLQKQNNKLLRLTRENQAFRDVREKDERHLKVRGSTSKLKLDIIIFFSS